MKLWLWFVCLLGVELIAAERIVIDFDDMGAPELLADARPLKDAYRHLGVRFSPGSEIHGPSVLEADQAWAEDQYSSPNILWFCRFVNNHNALGGNASLPLVIEFDEAVDQVDLEAGSFLNEDKLATLSCFDDDDRLLNSVWIVLGRKFEKLKLAASGIRRCVFASKATYGAVDNLAFYRN